MVSIKRYLGYNDSESALRQAVSLLVGKIGEGAVKGDARELTAFSQEMRGIREGLTPELPLPNVLILVGSAIQEMETYNRRITRTIGQRSDNFQTIFRMLREGLVKIAGENTESVQSLCRIGAELERSIGFEDLQALKLHLGQCLSGLREEIEREKSASRTLIEKLQGMIENVREPGARLPQPRMDTATGTPFHAECLAAIQEAIGKGTRHYAAVMVVNRVQSINTRFGRDAGDRMQLRFKEHVESHLFASDQLFRWTGSAIVAILERPEPADRVRETIRRIIDARVEETYRVSGRSVLIPISAAWSVIALTSPVDATEKQIEAFIATQGNCDPA